MINKFWWTDMSGTQNYWKIACLDLWGLKWKSVTDHSKKKGINLTSLFAQAMLQRGRSHAWFVRADVMQAVVDTVTEASEKKFSLSCLFSKAGKCCFPSLNIETKRWHKLPRRKSLPSFSLLLVEISPVFSCSSCFCTTFPAENVLTKICTYHLNY